MTTAVPMFTEEAQGILDRYLGRVKSTLRPHPSVDADEVERDVRGHIEVELAGAPAPVTADQLGSVLERLGSPSAWVPADDLPAWRRLLMRVSAGPEDFRLSYLALGCFLLFPIAPPLLLASFLLARAGLALLDERSEPVGARAWLLYPPLLFLYVDLAIVALLLPPVIVPALAFDPNAGPAAREFLQAWLPDPFPLAAALLAALVAGAWWLVLGLALARCTRAVRWTFWPFAEGFERRHGIRIAVVGLVVAAASGAALAAVFRFGA